MKFTLSLIAIMAFSLLIPQKAHALSCVAASYNVGIAQGNFNVAQQNNLPLRYWRIALDEAKRQLSMCQDVETIDFED
ncbi:MAG: hypothetical protein JKY19_00415 [Alcanivoracaceae bacterium]|nr:hypothetical protein [Alcanivoracaceae bacterium]